MLTKKSFLLLGVTLGVTACAAAPPTAPSVLALPSAGKDLARFGQEDLSCRQYAATQIAGHAPAEAAGGQMQERYDMAYAQCMAANGDQLQGLPVPIPYAYGYPVYYGAWGEPAFGFGFVGRVGPRFHHRFFIHRGGFHRG